MANYSNLKNIIDQVVRTNGQGDITGANLNHTLQQMVTDLGANYQYAGVAVPSTNPGSPDQNVFYIATLAGKYSYFNSIVLPKGITVLRWNGSWSSTTLYTVDTGLTPESEALVQSGTVFEKFKFDGGPWAVSAHFPSSGPNNDGKFTLEYILTNANTLIPVIWRMPGMSIKFIDSENKYVQYRYMGTATTGNPNPFIYTANWQGVDTEPSEESINLVESGGVFNKIDDIVNGTKSYLSLNNRLVSYAKYINSNNTWANSNYLCKFIIGNLADVANEIKIVPNENTSCVLAFVKKISGGAPGGTVEYKNGTSGLITITKPTTFKVNEECSLYLYSRISASETTHIPSDVLKVIRTKEEITVNTEHVIDESSNKTQQQINTEQSDRNLQSDEFERLTLNEIFAEYNNETSGLDKIATSNANIITDNKWSDSGYIQRKLDLRLMSPCLLVITPINTLNIAFVKSLGSAGTSVQYANNTDSVIHLTGKKTFFVKDKCILYIERKRNASDTEHLPSEVDIYQRNEFIWNNIVGEKLTIIGDSISFGAGASIPSRAYAPQLCSKYRAVLNNLSISGSCIGYGDNRFVNRLTQENMTDSKLVIVWGGTNDFTRQVVIGNYYDEITITPSSPYEGTKKMVPNNNVNQFSGALHNLIQTIQTYCPATPILFITPLKRALSSESTLASDTCNTNGNYLKDYVEAIKEVCNYYSIPVLDMYSNAQLNPLSSAWSSYFVDGLHPNDYGHKLVADIIFRYIENNVVI